MSDQKTADNEPVRDVDWYLGVYRASQELKDRSYRTIPISAKNPKQCVTRLVRVMKKARMFQIRKLNRKIEQLKKKEEVDQAEIDAITKSIDGLESIDLLAVVKSLFPELLMIPTPKNYQKPISEEQQQLQDMLTQSKEVRLFVEEEQHLCSVPRKQVNKDDIDDVATDMIQASTKEVLKDDKNRPVKLEEMTRKQRRAAEYRLMREAESQSSKFITSLKSSKAIGAASIMSRKEAARKTLMSMELPERIRDHIYNKEEAEETPKPEGRGKKPFQATHSAREAPKEKKFVKEKKPMTEKVVKEKEEVKKPLQAVHPSWEAQKENREKQKLHIDANAPKQNTSIVFD
ncbi:hypothetical protein BLSTO_02078 [Blastocystis sp. subtype 1]